MSSVDDAEHRKFNQAHSFWWDVDGPLASLHEFNSARVLFFSKHFANNLHGQRILDIGCGGGILSISLARMGANVTGIDISSKSIEAATMQAQKSVYGSGSVKFHCTTLEEWTAQPCHNRDAFDIVVISEVLEHVKGYQQFLKEAMTCVRRPVKEGNKNTTEGGTLFLTTINRNLLSKLTMIHAAENLLGILPRGTHVYDNFIRPLEVKRALRKGNFRVVQTCGFVPIPHIFPKPRLTFAVSSVLTGVNYGMAARWM
ncbi:Ubiquinone biosynthesis O-methyltransferase [Perkinsela sp. CCAP 1560/4]|nr:Ubiquinone biosynthesis O-methyltransferase [Perkinsela sp. CCAP 1560/4]|eukprot:KNH03648.1 Ubiquinone biosynthesis O-methyltransferase [Perkinsela sp. CCAP 1560/4]